MTNTQVEDDKELNQEDTDVEWYRRANPNRAIYISGDINQDLVDHIQPEILKYRYESNEPITVYINSRGGCVDAAHFIHGLLKRPNQKKETCHIITVATGNAMSAAANLLALGDYAIAYPDAQIHYHGSRTIAEITAEEATWFANDLGKTNEQFASDMASNVITRYLYMYLDVLRNLPRFQQAKDNLPEAFCQNFVFANASENMFDVCAFSYFLSTQLNAPLDKLASNDALAQLGDLAFVQRLQGNKSPQPTVEAWNNMIDQKAFSKCQAESLKSDMSIFQALLKRRLGLISKQESGVNKLFDNMGWQALSDEFNYVTECLNGRYADKTHKILFKHQNVLLSAEEIQKYYEFSDDKAKECYIKDLAKQKLELLWFYVVTNCRLLQKGEYPMKVEDAYWLGLINEIVGQGIPDIKE
jgi:ATP-dependent protease ClpP protease subunit